MKGGSVASDAVVGEVSSAAFDKLSAHFTNQIGGRKSCPACGKKTQCQRGGSLASNAVNDEVAAGAFDKLSKQSTNMIGGRKACRLCGNKQQKRGGAASTGANSAASSSSVSTPFSLSAMINSARSVMAGTPKQTTELFKTNAYPFQSEPADFFPVNSKMNSKAPAPANSAGNNVRLSLNAKLAPSPSPSPAPLNTRMNAKIAPSPATNVKLAPAMNVLNSLSPSPAPTEFNPIDMLKFKGGFKLKNINDLNKKSSYRLFNKQMGGATVEGTPKIDIGLRSDTSILSSAKSGGPVQDRGMNMSTMKYLANNSVYAPPMIEKVTKFGSITNDQTLNTEFNYSGSKYVAAGGKKATKAKRPTKPTAAKPKKRYPTAPRKTPLSKGKKA